MNTTNKQSDRNTELPPLTESQIAFQWWEMKLTKEERCKLLMDWFGATNVSLDDKDILEIWRKETQPTTNTKESSTGHEATSGELQCTPGEWEIGELNSSFGNRYYKIPLHAPSRMVAETYGDTPEETVINADLIAASKDMYNALLMAKYRYDLWDRDEWTKPDEDAYNEIVFALKKANKNFKP